MPDLDQLLDTLLNDVSVGTRAPGAARAIQTSRRRRARTAVASMAAAVMVVVGGVLAAGTFGDERGRLLPAYTPSSSSGGRAVQEGSETSPISQKSFETQLSATLTRVPDWAVADGDPSILQPCGGEWSSTAGGWSGGSIGMRAAGQRPSVWAEQAGFPSAAQASGAVATLVANLESCGKVDWQTLPIAQPNSVLAFSSVGVVWVHREGSKVSTLQVPTKDGLPPRDVQVEVDALIRSFMG